MQTDLDIHLTEIHLTFRRVHLGCSSNDRKQWFTAVTLKMTLHTNILKTKSEFHFFKLVLAPCCNFKPIKEIHLILKRESYTVVTLKSIFVNCLLEINRKSQIFKFIVASFPNFTPAAERHLPFIPFFFGTVNF